MSFLCFLLFAAVTVLAIVIGGVLSGRSSTLQD